MSEPVKRPGFLDVFTVRFWINFAIVLLVTLPVPLLTIEINGQPNRSIPIYECYLDMLQGKFGMWRLRVMGMHLSIGFIISYAVWYGVMWWDYRRANSAGG